MPGCKLTSDFIPVDCRDAGIGGTSGAVYFIDYDDWINSAKVQDADNTYTGVTLPAGGSEAIKYDLFRGAPVPSSPYSQNDGGQSGFTHTLSMFVSPSNKQSVKDQWVGYGNYRRVVAIVVLDHQDVAQVYGVTTGMSISAYDELPNDQATGGGFTLTLTTPTNTTLEIAPSDKFFNTDRATTITALEALLTPTA
jgi:hypothetical protein